MAGLVPTRVEFSSAASPIPAGVKLLALSRAVRWTGWGFGEALLPVFILSFSNTFLQSGFMSSIADIASLLSLPVIGMWADQTSSRRLVLISLVMYPLVGMGYFLAGALGLALLLALARAGNGLLSELENIGIETYFRRSVMIRHVASSFGYIETWAHLFWIAAALIGMLLVTFVSIHVLLLCIAPFAIAAYAIAIKAPADRPEVHTRRPIIVGSYVKAFTSLWNSDRRLRCVWALAFFGSVINSLMYFFIPIDAFIAGANLPMVVLVTIFGSVPALLSYRIGLSADSRNSHLLIILGLLGVSAVIAGLIFIRTYWFKLLAVFAAGIILEIFYIVQSRLVTEFGPPHAYGLRGSVMESVEIIGNIAAPIILGIAFDSLGFSSTLVMIIACAAILVMIFLIELGKEQAASEH